MALVGLDKVYVSKITEGVDGVDTYGVPANIANAIEATITPSIDTQNIPGDDGVAEVHTVFGSVDVSFTFADIGSANYALLLGKSKDSNGVVIDSADDIAPYFALGYRSKKSNGEYRYFWLYKGKFATTENSHATQQGNADYQTQPITGTFIKRKSDGQWRARVDSDDTGVAAGVITNWFGSVYDGV